MGVTLNSFFPRRTTCLGWHVGLYRRQIVPSPSVSPAPEQRSRHGQSAHGGPRTGPSPSRPPRAGLRDVRRNVGIRTPRKPISAVRFAKPPSTQPHQPNPHPIGSQPREPENKGSERPGAQPASIEVNTLATQEPIAQVPDGQGILVPLHRAPGIQIVLGIQVNAERFIAGWIVSTFLKIRELAPYLSAPPANRVGTVGSLDGASGISYWHLSRGRSIH